MVGPLRIFSICAAQVYGSKLSAGLSTGAGGLPTQQKILLASLLLMLKRGRTKEVTLGKLMETYTKVCIADNRGLHRDVVYLG
jgi:cell division control protein 6